MEQYVKGFQRFHAGEDVRPVTSALASFYHLFQVYYKVRQVLLQSATAFLLQSATGITKCNDYYKVRQLFLLQTAMVCYHKVRQLFYYKVRQVITKCDNFITKCNRYYKVRRLLQSATVHGAPFPCTTLFMSCETNE